MSVRLLEVARGELDEAIAHYNKERPGLGEAFLVEILATVERIRRFPDGWHPMAPGLRRCLMRRFPYGLIYGREGPDIVIVAVAHTRRRPEYWRDRLR